VNRDEIVGLLGPNGAGKTTALEIVLGLRDADSGTARIFDASPRDMAVRRRVGATPQQSGFPDMLSVDEIAQFVAAHYPRPALTARALEEFGLTALAKRRAATLSGGETRRLALALAFLGNPELVVLDEPTTGLDVESRRRLWNAIRARGAGRSILFTTHYLEEAQELATRIVVIDQGHVLFDGAPRALRERVGGRRVSYVGSDGPVTMTALDADEYVRTMVAAGVQFQNLEIARPSLEEAFLSLTGRDQ
jgi:ABC-2 type transport system ATP-binding protein